MCLVVLYLGDQEAGDQQQVILAANRDEYFSRPTTPCRYYFDPDTAFNKSFETRRNHRTCPKGIGKTNKNGGCSNKPAVLLGPRDMKCGDDKRPLLGSPFLVGSGKRWAVITNALGPWGSTHDSFNIPRNRFAGILRRHDPREFLLMGMTLVLTFLALYVGQRHQYRLLCCCLALAVLFNSARRMEKNIVQNTGNNGLKARGQLLASFVNSCVSPKEFVNQLSSCPDMKFGGFSLIVGVGNYAYFVSNRPHKLEGGKTRNGFYTMKLQKGKVYGLSNAFFDDPRGKVKKAKKLFNPVVQILGCQAKEPRVSEPISEEARNAAVTSLFQSVMGNKDKCALIPTMHIRDVDEKLAHIFVSPFPAANAGSIEQDIFGTRDTVVMIMNFDDVTDEQIGLDGISIWEINHSVHSRETFAFDENSHRTVAKEYQRYLASAHPCQSDAAGCSYIF